MYSFQRTTRRPGLGNTLVYSFDCRVEQDKLLALPGVTYLEHCPMGKLLFLGFGEMFTLSQVRPCVEYVLAQKEGSMPELEIPLKIGFRLGPHELLSTWHVNFPLISSVSLCDFDMHTLAYKPTPSTADIAFLKSFVERFEDEYQIRRVHVSRYSVTLQLEMDSELVLDHDARFSIASAIVQIASVENEVEIIDLSQKTLA